MELKVLIILSYIESQFNLDLKIVFYRFQPIPVLSKSYMEQFKMSNGFNVTSHFTLLICLIHTLLPKYWDFRVDAFL